MINHLQLRLLISILFIYLKGRNCRDINGTRFNSQLGRVFITNHSTTISSSTKFSFPPLHNDNTTTKPPQLNTTFTWPPINNNNSTTTKTPHHHQSTSRSLQYSASNSHFHLHLPTLANQRQILLQL